MRKVYVAITGLLMVSVILQFYFAAFGVFTAPDNDSQFILHQMNGRIVLPVLCLLSIAAAAAARAPGRLIGLTAIPFGLLILQTVLFIIAGLAGASEDRTNLAGQLILGLHAINGLCVLGTSILVFLRARQFARLGTGPVLNAPATEDVETAAVTHDSDTAAGLRPRDRDIATS
ncbi:DUF6220 domain-containing protein [Nakamurella sp. GG22]